MRINFELLDLRAFLAVIDLGGFHRAAESLAISQPALSRRVQSLENAIGAPLFERSTRRVAPTMVGRAFVPTARQLLDDLERAILGISGLGSRQSGSLTLACVPTAVFYFLPLAIEQFTRAYPQIRFRIMDLSANDALESVRSGEAEFGINFIGATDADLVFTSLLEDPFVLACHRGHRLATQKKISWADLSGEALVGVSRHSGNRQMLEAALVKDNIHLEFRYEVNHLSTSLGLVERGLGVAVLPRLATPPADHPVIATRILTAPIVRRTIGIVERRNSRLSPLAQRFRDMLVTIWPGTIQARAKKKPRPATAERDPAESPSRMNPAGETKS